MNSYSEDLWQHLREYTSARIALGRTGNSVPTSQLLDFQLAHAMARDAVHKNLDVAAVTSRLSLLNLPSLHLQSQALDRRMYLQRPDLGRKLDRASVEQINNLPQHTYDLSLVIADGLSALAIEKNTKPLLEELLPLIRQQNYSLAPVCIVAQGRVAIGDEIAFLLNSRMVVMLIGERPGLSSPDSLGIYLTYQPQIGFTDEKRNCISNIRPGGLPYAFAAQKLIYLLNESFRRKLSGVQLKDDMDLRIMQ